MNTNKTIGKKIVILFGLACLLSVASCSSDDEGGTVTPSAALPIISVNGDSEGIVRSGSAIEVDLNFVAEAGNQSLVVNRNGGLLEEISLDAAADSFTYNTQVIPDDAEEGEVFEFEFILVDTQNQESTPVSYSANTAVYDTIEIGGTSVYEVTIPEFGIVSSGTSIKFIEGRDYFIGGSLDFDSGSSFTVEADVTIYMAAGLEDSAGITANSGSVVAIEGSASNPIVITSSNVLTGNAESGDWDRFELEETENAILRYVRMEYATTSLRLDAVDNSNTVEYIQSYYSSEEGFYTSNGNVNFKYLINTKSGDTGFRFGDAYTGKMQFIITQGEDHDETEFYVRENASIIASNLTLLGPGEDAEEGGDIIEINSSANTFKIYNSIISQSVDEDIKFDGDMPISDLQGDNVLAYSYFFNNDDPLKDNAIDFFGTFDEDGTLLTNPFYNNAITGGSDPDDLDFEEIDGIDVDQFVPNTSVTAKESFNPSTVDAFFTSVTFVGAVENAENDWTTGWVKNVDGSIR
ncbi:hypothetical protein [Winogradskyella vidalii]|uniref:hypothetical protein n=1 Tax=Winogradskyella vidalii TaxID=2615024 RepID=UPI0015CB65E9|nr:hypothetical protein [Winogradskyella vidalii]